MPGEFWEFLSLLLKDYGLLSIVVILESVLVVYLFWLLSKKETEKTGLQDKLVEMAERRLEDAKEEREDYEELARNLDKSINLLATVVRRRNGHEGDE